MTNAKTVELFGCHDVLVIVSIVTNIDNNFISIKFHNHKHFGCDSSLAANIVPSKLIPIQLTPIPTDPFNFNGSIEFFGKLFIDFCTKIVGTIFTFEFIFNDFFASECIEFIGFDFFK